ncbi:MAG: hypothetical protein NTX59_08035 [Elusimicrobia bacterium]|nr:hypothetical protein [Elusimicrobiota bacterium]
MVGTFSIDVLILLMNLKVVWEKKKPSGVGGSSTIHAPEGTSVPLEAIASHPEGTNSITEKNVIGKGAPGNNYRGSYDPIQRLITLGPDADASTVIHELIHNYFTQVHDFIKTGQADEVTKKDFETLRQWATADPKQVLLDIKTEAATTTDKTRNKELKKVLADIKQRGGVDYIRKHGETKFLDSSNKTEQEITRQYHERMARGWVNVGNIMQYYRESSR